MRKIILIGMKSCGKTTVGRMLSRRLVVPFADLDAEAEHLHFERTGERLHFREIFARRGKDYFRALETDALRGFAAKAARGSFVLATGGGLPLAEENRAILRTLGTVVFIDTAQNVLLHRITARGIPAFFPYPDDPARSLTELLAARRPVYQALAQITVSLQQEGPETVAALIHQQLETLPREN